MLLAIVSWAFMLAPLLIFSVLRDLSSFWYIYGLSPVFVFMLLGSFFMKYTKARSESWYMLASAVLFLFSLFLGIAGFGMSFIHHPQLYDVGLSLLLISTFVLFVSLVFSLIAYSGLPRVDMPVRFTKRL
jgi:hypothetical protein